MTNDKERSSSVPICHSVILSFVIGVVELWGGGCGISGSTLPSPDPSRFIAFALRRLDGSYALAVANETRSIQRGINPQVTVGASLSLSPERNRIIFEGGGSDGSPTDLYIVLTDPLASAEPLTATADISEAEPDWSCPAARQASGALPRALPGAILARERPLARGATPNGRYVVYAGDGDVWRLELDPDNIPVGEPTNVTQTPNAIEGQPAASPDGSRIAFTLNPGANDSGIGVINADGTGRQVLVNDPEYDEYLPAWSPDGSRIAYTARRLSGDGAGRIDIWTVAADGSGRQNVTNTDGRYTYLNPKWAPDGRQLAFLGIRLGEAGADIFISGAGGEGRHRFQSTPDSEADLDWR